MRKYFSISVFLIVSVVFITCNSPESKSETNIITTTVQGDENKVLATVDITGMSCEMMCGSRIKKSLAEIPGVMNTTIQFDAEKEHDYAIVELHDKVNGEQLVAAVEGIAGGDLYKVNKVEIQKTEKKEPSNIENQAGNNSNNSGVNNSTGISIELPNLFESITNFIR